MLKFTSICWRSRHAAWYEVPLIYSFLRQHQPGFLMHAQRGRFLTTLHDTVTIMCARTLTNTKVRVAGAVEGMVKTELCQRLHIWVDFPWYFCFDHTNKKDSWTLGYKRRPSWWCWRFQHSKESWSFSVLWLPETWENCDGDHRGGLPPIWLLLAYVLGQDSCQISSRS